MKMNKSEKIFERCRVQKDINEIRDGIWTTNHSVLTSTVTLVFYQFPVEPPTLCMEYLAMQGLE